MKKISMILMAFALAMMMSQCKKNEGQTTSNDKVVTITLDVKQNNGSKVVVNPNTGTVDFETGDKIYVGSGGKYVGFLTHNGTNFSGNITNPTENQPLQFYFLGNVTPQETLSAGTTEECTVIISDQTEHLPVISCAASNENYVSGLTIYSAHLLNKCALVKFNVTTPSNSPICITGMKNKVTVDFTQNTMTPSMDGEGVIVLPAESGENIEKWAILLPQEALEEGENGSAYSEDGAYSGARPAILGITGNEYLSDGLCLTVNSRVFPEGALGLFSVEENRQVYFSRGNLQYIGSASTPYWKFADHQWDCFGTTTGQNSDEQNVDRDLFGWGTSGYNHGAICYQPWSTSTNYTDYYIHGSYSSDISGWPESDWGYNPISNGGNTENGGWRTLSGGPGSEWAYVFNGRVTPSGIRFAKAQVNNIDGVILLPDDWNASTYGLNYPNSYEAAFNHNTISASQWSILENAGAVFLPITGFREGTSIVDLDRGFYWSSNLNTTIGGIYYQVYSVRVTDTEICIDASINRGCGLAVRLVQDYHRKR